MPPTPRVKGRGTVTVPPHRFEAWRRMELDDGWPADAEGAEGTAPSTQVREEHARSILSRNDSPDIGFELSINPYRGCEHGCIYCYARPLHSYLDLSPGLDFETRLVAKVNAAELLRAALSTPRFRPQRLCLGAATDCYQPVERRLRITRSVIEVLGAARHPFSIITKGAGIERDLDLLAPLAAQRLVGVYVSVTSLNPELSRRLEPRAAAPARRLQLIERLSRAGVPVGVSVSPTIPFLNEPEMEKILSAAREAGAQTAFSIPLRLPWEVAPLFREWLQNHYPERAERVMARVNDMRGGKDNDARFGSRMRGVGVWAEFRAQRFRKACQRSGLGQERFDYDFSRFRAPGLAAQGELF
ncbi:PA0069 family radical SAM protein [Inhella gelatinilytica]|uniref:PA0069 family radical SAM protein n=1 Tax=Inhella gelatinilytica TaxID=2795030 RepID=A0A931NDU8_9BURK|nr:PA0069 family radical SAM protein [Inhella gelatinilytica]MBH9553472.1 PA0069 family radical SAM protein [Inhella gelatinilytica]